MRIYTSEQAYDQGPCVAALGTFDGVHLGHQALIRAAVREGQEKGLRSAVFTFDGHPLQLLRPAEAPAPLLTGTQRHRLLEKMGLDVLVERPFTREFAALSPEEFVHRLAECLRLSAVVVGYNHSFGRGGKGNGALLQSMGRELGFRVITVEPVMMDGLPVSSTRIRQLFREGQTREAQRLLGHDDW